jgi:hypothetical protein
MTSCTYDMPRSACSVALNTNLGELFKPLMGVGTMASFKLNLCTMHELKTSVHVLGYAVELIVCNLKGKGLV